MQLSRFKRLRMPVSVWIDGQRRIRQLRMEGDLGYFFGSYRGTLGSDLIRFERFDRGIEIEGPPISQVRTTRRPP